MQFMNVVIVSKCIDGNISKSKDGTVEPFHQCSNNPDLRKNGISIHLLTITMNVKEIMNPQLIATNDKGQTVWITSESVISL